MAHQKKYYSLILFLLVGWLTSAQSNKAKTPNDSIPSVELQMLNKGYPVTGVMKDTLFYIHSKLAATLPRERAINITKRIQKLYDEDFLKIDSIYTSPSEHNMDIVYGDFIIMSVSEMDARWYGKSILEVSDNYNKIIKASLRQAKSENNLTRWLLRIGLILLVVGLTWLVLHLIGKGYKRLYGYLDRKKDAFFKDFIYKDYTFLKAEQESRVIFFLVRISRWLVYLLLGYVTLPLIFSIFPFSRQWAGILFNLIWSPLKSAFLGIWNFMPNLFSILVIFFVMKYLLKFVKYIFSEIDAENLKISGFHPDWAKPTNSIVTFLLYAFMFVLIFPLLPGSSSHIFQGVSVFIGVLLSLGSSSSIANVAAGLIITYMRPYKIGDFIKIGDVIGDVVEKNLLVTRLRTIKNEEITIPNSTVLSGNTINYSTLSKSNGLIINTKVTIGYSVPWKDIHQALLTASDRTIGLLKEPKPFVFQTSLDDFFVTYQINAYTQEANRQAFVYSELHQHIQDCCNEMGIEIMSPHYQSNRDGNTTAIPTEYLPKGYKAPGFKVTSD